MHSVTAVAALAVAALAVACCSYKGMCCLRSEFVITPAVVLVGVAAAVVAVAVPAINHHSAI
jgi:hypothetical protein